MFRILLFTSVILNFGLSSQIYFNTLQCDGGLIDEESWTSFEKEIEVVEAYLQIQNITKRSNRSYHAIADLRKYGLQFEISDLGLLNEHSYIPHIENRFRVSIKRLKTNPLFKKYGEELTSDGKLVGLMFSFSHVMDYEKGTTFVPSPSLLRLAQLSKQLKLSVNNLKIGFFFDVFPPEFKAFYYTGLPGSILMLPSIFLKLMNGTSDVNQFTTHEFIHMLLGEKSRRGSPSFLSGVFFPPKKEGKLPIGQIAYQHYMTLEEIPAFGFSLVEFYRTSVKTRKPPKGAVFDVSKMVFKKAIQWAKYIKFGAEYEFKNHEDMPGSPFPSIDISEEISNIVDNMYEDTNFYLPFTVPYKNNPTDLVYTMSSRVSNISQGKEYVDYFSKQYEKKRSTILKLLPLLKEIEELGKTLRKRSELKKKISEFEALLIDLMK